jgi:hypothetical protein
MELGITDLKLSNPTPSEGEEIKVYAKIKNFGGKVEGVWAIFYYTTELPFKKEVVEKFIKPEFEIYRELISRLDEGESTVITFDWKAKKDMKTIFVFTKEETS